MFSVWRASLDLTASALRIFLQRFFDGEFWYFSHGNSSNLLLQILGWSVLI